MEREEYCKTCRHPQFQGCYFCKLADPDENGVPYGYVKQVPIFEGKD